MAYKTEKEQNGRTAIVISGWEKGIAGSAYGGIANMMNLNIRYQPGVVYTNYARQAATISGGTMSSPSFYAQSPTGLIYILDTLQQVWKQNIEGGTTFTLLSGNPSAGDGNGIAWWNGYLLVFGTDAIDICGTGNGPGQGDTTIISSNWNTGNTASGVWPIANTTITMTDVINSGTSGYSNTTASIPAGSTSATLATSWTGVTGVYAITFSDGEVQNALITNGATTMDWSSSGTTAIPSFGLANTVSNLFQYTGPTQSTLSSYNDGNGDARSFWNGPTGTYQATLSTGQILAIDLTQGQTYVSWGALITTTATDTVTITILFPGMHMAHTSVNDGNLYFCNGSNVGALAEIPGFAFSKYSMLTATLNYSALGLPQYETAVWLEDLQTNLLVAGNKHIYPWDRVSTSWATPMPITEQIVSIVNMTNVIFVFAGEKGNIYVTNGYSISLLKKIPDSMFNLIDPLLQWGGYMTHRNKLYFQVFASTNNGVGVASAIFSLDVIPAQLPTELDTSGSLTVENQNSFGYTPVAGYGPKGLLMDYGGNDYDSYFSAWFNDSAGGVDYNTTTLYQDNEPLIETDLIPVGTFLEQCTFENVEYKLDQPLANGDSITLYYRESLSSSYTLIGTTTATSDSTTQVLSDNFNSNVINSQWVQFKVTFACAASGSSFIRLREIRLH